MTENTHSQRILRNSLYGLSTWIFPLFLGLIVTRVVVRSLGNVDYGIYALVLGFIAYSFNFSIGRAITKYLASYRAAGDTERIETVVSATAFLTVSVAAIGILLIISLSGWMVRDVFGIAPDEQLKTITAFRISAGTIFVLMLTQIPSAVLQGLHRFDIFSRIQNANSIIMMLGNLWLAYNGYGLVALLYWNLAAAVVTCTYAFISARRVFPELRFTIRFDREVVGLVIRYSAGVVGYQLVANAFFLFERSWVIAKLGAEALTFYVIPMTIGIYLHGFVSSLALVLFPLASEFENDRERLTRLYRTATKSLLFIVVIIAASLVAEGKLFLTLWMGPEFGERSYVLLVLLTIAFGMAALTIVSFQTAEGLGHPGFNFRNAAIGVMLGLPVILGLTDEFGSAAVAVGRLLAFLIPFLAIFNLEHRFLGGIQTSFWVGNVLRFGTAAVSAFFVEKIVISVLGMNWFTFLLSTFAGCLVYLAILWLAGAASTDDRVLVRRLIQREA
jgi:O-antigen/teichoic acid export membrane protein